MNWIKYKVVLKESLRKNT